MRIPEYKARIGGGIFMALFALALYFFIIPAEINLVRQKIGASPRLFPNILAWGLFLFSVALTVEGYKIRNDEHQNSYTFGWKESRIVLATLGIIAVQAIGFDAIGYLIPASLALAACMYLYGQRNYLLIILISVLLPLGIKLFFAKTLQVYLP